MVSRRIGYGSGGAGGNEERWDLGCEVLLGNEAFGAGTRSGSLKFGRIPKRYHHHADRGIQHLDVPGSLETGHARQVEVHQNEISPLLFEMLESVASIARRLHHDRLDVGKKALRACQK